VYQREREREIESGGREKSGRGKLTIERRKERKKRLSR
jgi:hypothetical protein